MAILFISCLMLFILFLWILSFLNIDHPRTLKQVIMDIVHRKHSNWLSSVFQVNEDSQTNGGDLVAAVLKAHGIRELFTLCGGHISPILVAAEKLGINVFDTRHEATAVFAADAVARLRQSIGVAVVTAGPGLTNTMTAVKNAQMAESPIIVIAGAAPALLKNRGALQDIDQLTLMRPLCKLVSRVTRVRDIIPVLRNAICTAQSGTPGPVFVEIPVDVLYPYEMVLKGTSVYKGARTFREKIINFYLEAYIARLFGGNSLDQNLLPLSVKYPLPCQSHISKLAGLIEKSSKPLLLVGSQAVHPPTTVNELRKTIEILGIPTYLSGMARGLLGKKSPFLLRHDRKEALKNADLIILAGAVCDFRLQYGRALSSRADIVAINRNKAQMRKNEGVYWRGKLLISGDVGTTLSHLVDFMTKNAVKLDSTVDNWKLSLAEKENEKNATNRRKFIEKLEDGKLNPLYILSMINKALPENAIIIADGGDFVGSAAYIVQPRGPLKWLDPGAFGTLGVGAGFALGAKAVHPDMPVVILYGDGSCGFSIMEFDTFARHKMSVIALIGNDACWSQIAREQVAVFKSSVAVDLAHSRYDELGKALGVQGEIITSENDFSEKPFEKIFQTAVGGKSVVVNLIIGRSNFRDGSSSL